MKTSSTTRLHQLSRRAVTAVALGLFVGVSLLLFFNQRAGFTRDESFYFNYAEGYQEWFHDIEQATAPEDLAKAFGREPTMRIWSGNFEHPPLMKDLFGFSWRLLARKDRRITGLKQTPEGLRFDVIAPRAAGFEEGASVILLRPQHQIERQDDPAREVLVGAVTKRDPMRAEVLVAAAHAADPALVSDLVEQCKQAVKLDGRDPATIPIAGCMGREDSVLHVLSESQAMRLPGIVSAGLAVMLTFLLGELIFGWLTGLVAGLLFIFVPEHFFHGQLACFDMPIVAAQLFCVYAFWRALSDRRWALVTAVAWGIALLTKHNAFFVPFALIVFWLWCGRDQLSLTLRPLRLRFPPLPLAFLVMPVVGLTMLFTFWPRLWYDPLHSLRDWFGFHLHHEHYMQYWFGEPLQVPPFPLSYPFEKTLLTYPEIFLVLLFIGLLFLAPPSGWKRWFSRLFTGPDRSVSEHEKAGFFLFVNGLVPICVIALPATPIFGGIKHWMTGAPFLAIIAAYGLARLVTALHLPRTLALAVAALVVAHPAKASLDNVWLGTNYYNALFAGGLQGAADKHLMRIFWGHEARHACAWLNAHAPPHARVYWQDATWGTYDMYQREGWLREDIRYHPGPQGADIVLNEPLQALWTIDLESREALGVAGPTWVLDQDGVPYLLGYVRPQEPKRSLDDVRRPGTQRIR